MEFLKFKKAKAAPTVPADKPVVDEDTEAFLRRILEEPEGTPPPLPDRPQDLAVAGEDQNLDTQLVIFDDTADAAQPDPAERQPSPTADASPGPSRSKSTRWSFLRRGSKTKRRKSTEEPTKDEKTTPDEPRSEEDEMANMLEQLNLAAINNRAFSLSKESQDLLQKYVAEPHRVSGH